MRAVDASTEAFTNMLMGAGEPRTDRSDRQIECRGGLRIAQARPIADSYDLLFLDSKRAQEHQYPCHLTLIV
jgi:hypothetical protein